MIENKFRAQFYKRQVDDPSPDDVIRAQDQGLHAFFDGCAANPYPAGSALAAHWLQSYCTMAQIERYTDRLNRIKQ